MYFRTKVIKGTPLVQLVESYRNAEGLPRQRVVASLGAADIPEDEKSLIAGEVTRRLRGGDEEELAGLGPELSGAAAGWVARIVGLAGRSGGARQEVGLAVANGVLLDKIETVEVVQLGPGLVAMAAWDALGFTPMLKDLGMNKGRIATAQLMVANRLIEPLSEWALIDWSQRTALPEMLEMRITKTTKDRLYYTGDDLLKHRVKIEQRLRARERELFDLGRSIILYDVTNTHFEGVCKANPKAKHGKNKQKRYDCRQVAVGMAFDEHGLPLAHENFEGNIADTKTLGTLLERLAPGDCDTLRPVVVLDAGFASKENIALLKDRGFSYLINMTRGSRTKYAGAFAAEGFESLLGRKAGMEVEVKRIADPEDAGSQLVLCRSAQRRLKEMAMILKAEGRFLTDVESLRRNIGAGRLKKPSVIDRRIGRLQKKHPKVQRFYTLSVEGTELSAERDDTKLDEVIGLCGDHVLKTDKDMPADELWGLYMTLLEAERGFQMLKGTLGLRPNFHQLEGRVDAHIFISVLAYHLLSWVRHHLNQAEDPREWVTLRRLLSTHSLVTTRLPLKDGRILSVRKPSLPDAEQALIYKTLSIDWKKACPPKKTELIPSNSAAPATTL